MIRYNDKVLKTIPLFFRHYNDVDVYVEDINDKVFYKELFSRLVKDQFKIVSVFPLGGRQNILEQCKMDQRDGGRPRIYLVDGDFDLILGENYPCLKRLFRLKRYCIENYLINEEAIVQVLYENSGELDRKEINRRLQFKTWLHKHSKALIELFITFACAKKLCPSLATVSLGLSQMLQNTSKGPILDIDKVNYVRNQIRTQLISLSSEKTIKEYEKKLHSKWNYSPETVCTIVSGKDYLLPMVIFKMKSIVNFQYTTRTTRFRLALHCSTDQFEDLINALFKVSTGELDFYKLNNIEKHA